MSADLPEESDCAASAPHPRLAAKLFGQDAAETLFLDAANSGRMQQVWLLAGPKGIGKATFAWRAARFLLATPPRASDGLFGAGALPRTLDVPFEHPVAQRMRALSEPGLLLLRRPWDPETKKLKSQITVDEIRTLKGFFHLSAGDGRRVVILDCADEMNVSAANALLKELEEPPEGAVMFLVSHQPAQLLPTIRSRCRVLNFAPLADHDLNDALNQAGISAQDQPSTLNLANGSAGAAIQLIEAGGAALYTSLLALMDTLPRLDRPQALELAHSVTGKGNEARFDLILSLLETIMARAARLGATGASEPEIFPGEAASLARLSHARHHALSWAELSQSLTAKARRGKLVNLDPAALIFDIFLELDRNAGRIMN